MVAALANLAQVGNRSSVHDLCMMYIKCAVRHLACMRTSRGSMTFEVEPRAGFAPTLPGSVTYIRVFLHSMMRVLRVEQAVVTVAMSLPDHNASIARAALAGGHFSLHVWHKRFS